MLLSIIIPYYNSFYYLEKLLDCLYLQIGCDIEILIIDDGSENSGQLGVIKNKYQGNNVRFIHKPHGGVSSARNLGIELAMGKYIWFIDSDDLVDRHAIHYIIRQVLCGIEPDLIFLNHQKFSEKDYNNSEQKYLNHIFIQKCDSDQFLNYVYSNNAMMCGVWSFICRKALIDEHHLRFDESLYIYEDVDWIIQLILYSKQFKYISAPIYKYRIDNRESLTNKDYSTEKFFSVLCTIEKWYSYFKHFYTKKKAKATMTNYFINQHRLLLSLIGKLPANLRRYAIQLHTESMINMELKNPSPSKED